MYGTVFCGTVARRLYVSIPAGCLKHHSLHNWCQPQYVYCASVITSRCFVRLMSSLGCTSQNICLPMWNTLRIRCWVCNYECALWSISRHLASKRQWHNCLRNESSTHYLRAGFVRGGALMHFGIVLHLFSLSTLQLFINQWKLTVFIYALHCPILSTWGSTVTISIWRLLFSQTWVQLGAWKTTA